METGSDLFKIIRTSDHVILNIMLYACDFFFFSYFYLSMASGIVRGVISSVMEDEKLLQSTPVHDMKSFGRKFLSSTMDKDDDLELFDEFCCCNGCNFFKHIKKNLLSSNKENEGMGSLSPRKVHYLKKIVGDLFLKKSTWIRTHSSVSL